MGAVFAGLSASLAFGLVYYTIGGFTEEIIWRGHIQTRLIDRIGPIKGLMFTALLFSLWHVPVLLHDTGGVFPEALANSLLLFPIGLLFGYMMLKSQNILPSSIFHVFFNWTQDFFVIPGA